MKDEKIGATGKEDEEKIDEKSRELIKKGFRRSDPGCGQHGNLAAIVGYVFDLL